MEISRYTARRIALIMSAVMVICLNLMAYRNTLVSSKNEDETQNTETYVDVGNAVSTNNDNSILIRDRNRTDSYERIFLFYPVDSRYSENMRFDLECKTVVSECKVRQGIFHYRLQSDDEEAPIYIC